MSAILDRLEEAKRRFGPGEAAGMLGLLLEAGRSRFTDAASLIRFHEALLFVRAYPHDVAVLRQAEELLAGFSRRVEELRASGADLSAFENPEVSGIAGTSFAAVFSYAVARDLCERHSPAIGIDWDRCEKPERIAAALRRLAPLVEEDAAVEANVPYLEWLKAGAIQLPRDWEKLPFPPDGRADFYNLLELPLEWQLGDSTATRTLMRRPVRRIFYQAKPLLRRSDVSLEAELAGPPIPMERLSGKQGAEVLAVTRDTSAVRYRELHGFSFGDPKQVQRVDLGRGVEVFLVGVPPQHRLPLRAYHAGMFFRNGVPIGYVETLSFFDRIEVGFNLYYTFREGETAWLYARMLRIFHQWLGVTVVSVDPYQIGYHNQEAIDSGAFWFYRKLGFRSASEERMRVVAAEEARIAGEPGYRTPPKVLRRLAEAPILYEMSGAGADRWEHFSIRKLSMAATRRKARTLGDVLRLAGASNEEAARLEQAKRAPSGEERYLRLLQKQPELRDAIVRLGS